MGPNRVLSQLRVALLAALGVALAVPTTLYAQAKPAPSLWDFSVSVNEAWVSHLRLTSPTDPGDLVSRFGARLARVHNSARTQIAFGGAGSGLLHRQLTSLNRLNYSGVLAGSWQTSPRARLTFGDDLVAAYTYDHSVITESGTSLPLVLTHSNRARAGMSYSLSQSLTGALDLQHDWVKFDAAGLLGGQRFALQSSLSSQLNTRHSLGGAYAYQKTSVGTRDGYSHSLSVVWVGKLDSSWSATASAGPAVFRATGRSRTRWTPFVAAGTTANFQRGSLAARYDRKLSPAYGTGRDRLVDAASLGFSRTLGRNTTLTGSTSFSYSRDPDDPSFNFKTQAHGIDLSHSLGRGLSLGGGLAFRGRDVSDRPAVHSLGLSLAITYGHQWQ